MALIVVVTLVAIINFGGVVKETKAYSSLDTVFSSGMDLYFEDLMAPDDYLLDLSPYENHGIVKGGAELTWGKYGKAIELNPDFQSTFYSMEEDGNLINVSAVYGDARNASTGTVVGNETSITVGQQFTGGNYWVVRGFLFFDTSSIGSLTIDSAILSLYGFINNTETNFNVTIQNGQPTYPHSPLESGDYDMTNYTGDGGVFESIDFTVDEWNNITLNSDGRGWINKTGITKLALRSSRDINNDAPDLLNQIDFYSYENVTFIPRLTVNFALGDYVEIQDDDSLDLSSELTLMAWIKIENATQDQLIIGKENYDYVLNVWGTDRGSNNGHVEVGGVATNGTAYYFVSQGAVNDNEWHHIAFVKNSTTYSIYIDSALDSSVIRTFDFKVTTDNVYISQVGRAVIGIIDEARIYPIALTQPHIKNDMLTPMNKFKKYSFTEYSGEGNASAPYYSGFKDNDRNLPYARSDGASDFNGILAKDLIAGFQSYRGYVTLFDSRVGTNFGGVDFVEWAWQFYKDGKQQSRYAIKIYPYTINLTTEWRLKFSKYYPSVDYKTVIVNYTDYEAHFFPIIVDAWIGDDDKHFSMRVTMENVTLDDEYAFTYSFDLTDVNGDIKNLDWFDGWVQQRLYCQSQSFTGDPPELNQGYISVFSHRLIGSIIALVILVVVCAFGYQWVLRPVLKETFGLALPAIPFLPERPEDVISALADLAHQFIGGLGGLGNLIVSALSPIVDAIAKAANPFIQAFINFMSEILTALINVVVGLWNFIVLGIDGLLYAIFPALGPAVFSTFLGGITDFFAGLLGWTVTSIGYLVTLLTSGFQFIGSFFGKMLNTLSSVVTQLVTFVQTFFLMLGDTYTSGVNLWDDLGLSTWVMLGAILYPIYLFGLLVEKGLDAMLRHLTMVINIFSWIFSLLITVVQTFITIIISLLELIPVAE